MPSDGRHDHDVVFYARDEDLARQVTDYLLGVMRDNGVGVTVATPRHRVAIEARLEQAGVSLTSARAHGSYVALDAEEVLSGFMINGFADPAGFWRAISPVIRSASAGNRRVAVFGEMVALLWDDGLVNAAIEVEAMWNELAGQYPFSLLCAYPQHEVSCVHHLDALAEVCRLHAEVIGGPPELVRSD